MKLFSPKEPLTRFRPPRIFARVLCKENFNFGEAAATTGFIFMLFPSFPNHSTKIQEEKTKK